MRIAALVLTLLAALGAGNTRQPPVRQALAKILAHAESASMYRDRVDWPATRAEVLRLADTATTISALAPALRRTLPASTRS
jgi:hypothetical protein